MARQGLQRGSNQGYLQGVKTGLGMANHRTGFAGGITDGTANMDKLQDPATLTGLKKPKLFCNADNITTTASTITMTDVVGSGYALTQNLGAGFTPDVVAKDIGNLRNALDFNEADVSLFPTPQYDFAGESEYSVMMVVKIKPIASVIFKVQDDLNPGTLLLQTIDTAQTIQSTLTGGQPGNTNTSVYRSRSAGTSTSELQNYMILTFKARLAQPGGAGSEQELHINGTLKKTLFSSNFNVIATTMTSAQTFIVGNTRTDFNALEGNGMYLGAFLLFDYWLNESEQLRLENYFRDYYGYKF